MHKQALAYLSACDTIEISVPKPTLDLPELSEIYASCLCGSGPPVRRLGMISGGTSITPMLQVLRAAVGEEHMPSALSQIGRSSSLKPMAVAARPIPQAVLVGQPLGVSFARVPLASAD